MVLEEIKDRAAESKDLAAERATEITAVIGEPAGRIKMIEITTIETTMTETEMEPDKGKEGTKTMAVDAPTDRMEITKTLQTTRTMETAITLWNIEFMFDVYETWL